VGLLKQAVEMFQQLSDEECNDYDLLKTSLLKWYRLTEGGFRVRFKQARKETNESMGTFVGRLGRYFDGWVKMAKLKENYHDVRELILKDQLFYTFPREVQMFVKEKGHQDLEAMMKNAEDYIVAHGLDRHEGRESRPLSKPNDRDQRSHYHPIRSHSENFRGVQNRQRFERQKPVNSLSGTNVQGRDKYPPNPNFRGNQPHNFQGQRQESCENPNYGGFVNRPPIVCYSCGSQGHKSNVCPVSRSHQGQVTCQTAAAESIMPNQSNNEWQNFEIGHEMRSNCEPVYHLQYERSGDGEMQVRESGDRVYRIDRGLKDRNQ
jgi:hypothetical protein